MGGSFDARMLQQQQQDQQQAAGGAQLYNPDGSGKANDYSGPALPPPSPFPALGPAGGGKGLTVDRARLTQVASQMAADLAKLRATLQSLYAAGAGGGMIGGWPTADAFGTNAINAYEGIAQFYQHLNDAYDLVISNIHQTVTNYADAEAASVSAVRGVGPDAPAVG
jgi:hypothetical protein